MPRRKNTGQNQPAGKKAQASRVKGVNRMISEDKTRKKKSKVVKGKAKGTTVRGFGMDGF